MKTIPEVRKKRRINTILTTILFVLILSIPVSLYDTVKNWLEPSEEYKIVLNNEEDYYNYSLYINEEYIMEVNPSEYIYNNLFEGIQIKNAYICQSVRHLLRVILLWVFLIMGDHLCESILIKDKEPFQKVFSKIFKYISIICFLYLLIPNLSYFILKEFLSNGVVLNSISTDFMFILALGCINILYYLIYKRGIKIKQENDLIA